LFDIAVETVAGAGQGQLYLLGYSLDDRVRLVYLEAVGPHEKFYRDLERN
jgi:hypothetical protein